MQPHPKTPPAAFRRLTYPIYWGVLRRTLRGSSSRIALANPTLATTAPLGTSPTAADPSPSLHGSASCSTGFKDSASGSDSAV